LTGLPARALLALCTAAWIAPAGCSRDGTTVLVIVVTVSGSVPPVTGLEVTLSGPRGVVTREYARPGRQPITFPTTLSAELGGDAAGEVTIEVRALEEVRGTVAFGRDGPRPVRIGQAQTIYVRLQCQDQSCARDGGSGGEDGSVSDGGAPDGSLPPEDQARCGNARIDPGETCDLHIPAGEPGACPSFDCDDGVACTRDSLAGDNCTMVCTHTEVRDPAEGDGCCPANATVQQDRDCSATCGNGTVEAGESCDSAIATTGAGGCATAASCADGDPCTEDLLVSAGTCAVRCVHPPLTARSASAFDGCCPTGAQHATDADCPVVCGNGIREPGEACDTAIRAGGVGACPAACDDQDPCTRDLLEGSRCQAICSHTAIDTAAAGDGCCPAGADRNLDGDCPAVCGNGVVEAAESCDRAIASGPGVCSTGCPPSPSRCLRRTAVGSATTCSARCQSALVTACAVQSDGCCPAGCTAASDPDCSATCGNGTVEATETCDVGIAVGPGSCPTACSDGTACTADLLTSARTCHAACIFLPITEPRIGDGCCPPGAQSNLDADCAPICGNGVTETPWESCDVASAMTSCPTACPPAGSCASVSLAGAGSCAARCQSTAVVLCRDGDGCCPPSCSSVDDADCAAVCGNGVVEPGERCDRGVTAGFQGFCPASCNDGDPCTADSASGTVESCTRACSYARTTACGTGDACCPSGCDPRNDGDCLSECGDGVVGASETCDPPSSCPTACPPDGDSCTTEELAGDPARCTSVCRRLPVRTCSGARADGCCPTGCDRASDRDC
jgi:hypothetical protein